MALLITVGGVLFISSTNPAGLLLVRGVARQREFAVRATLGAGRGRMLCRMVTESVLLSFIGGGLGTMVAWWGTGFQTRFLAQTLLPVTLTPDGRVLVFPMAVSLFTGVLSGLIPAWRLSQVDPVLHHLQSQARGRSSFEPGNVIGILHRTRLPAFPNVWIHSCPTCGGDVEDSISLFLSKDIMPDLETEYEVTTDRSRFDVDLIHGFLSNSYWAQGVPRGVVECSIRNSLAFGVFHQQRQVGFARVTTDYATIGYIADLFVIPEYRGRGLSKLLIREILSHPKLAGVRRFLLATRDAHGLYARFGFKPLAQPDSFMTFQNPNAHPSPTG